MSAILYDAAPVAAKTYVVEDLRTCHAIRGNRYVACDAAFHGHRAKRIQKRGSALHGACVAGEREKTIARTRDRMRFSMTLLRVGMRVIMDDARV